MDNDGFGDQPEDQGDSKPNLWKKVLKRGLFIPYRSVYNEAVSFKTPGRICFEPGKPVHVSIVGVDRERVVSSHLLNPNLYVIRVEHGDHVWTIKKRYKHFQHLHQQLTLFRVALHVPFPSKTHQKRRETVVEFGKPQSLPSFPKKPEALVGNNQIDERKEVLEKYLQGVLNARAFRNHHETVEFLEISNLSFVQGLGLKSKEGLILKRTGASNARRFTCNLCTCVNTPCFRLRRCCNATCGHWQKRWLFIKESYIGYIRPKDGTIHCVMLYGPDFDVSSALYDVGGPEGIVISNMSRQLTAKCWTKRKAKEWLDSIRSSMSSEVAKGFIDKNRYFSFSPVRNNIEAQWFVDGSSYMLSVADALEGAQDEIYITDWWLSPEIYLKRPIIEGERWRLDKILERKAKQGVKIFVLLYKEVNLALGINSFYSKQKLVEKNSENIKVLRHPDHVSAGVLLWAHHEKLVIVDQLYAYVGGIDLCYGRWDDYKHRLTDLGSVTAPLKPKFGIPKRMTSSTPDQGHSMSILQLAKAANSVTIGTLGENRKSKEELCVPGAKGGSDQTDRKAEVIEDIRSTDLVKVEASPSLPGVQTSPSVDTISKYCENGDTIVKQDTPPQDGKRRILRRVTKYSRGLKEDGKVWIDRHLRRRNSGSDSSSDEEIEENIKREKAKLAAAEPAPILQGSSKLWIGKDYTNFIVKDFADLESPFTDLVDRRYTPRMPWHDIGVMVQGTAARDVARHFIQRWNATKDEKARTNKSYPYLLPKSYDLRQEVYRPETFQNYKTSRVSCQILRSVSQWSAGIHMVEESIQQAYVDAIYQAKHYIYIENQFFITTTNPGWDDVVGSSQVLNRIGEALYERILIAHRNNQTFRVFVIIPLLPGFEGEVGTNRGIAIHAITHWNYSSICRGEDSLLVRLRKEGVEDPSQYLTFHGLRNWSELQEDLVTELIYVHSKLMIVDDNVMICGSANINDRSMIGKRDSEVAVVIKDEQFIDARMNKEAYKAGKFVHSMRMHLFKEHLGLMEKENSSFDIVDPICDEFYHDIWIKISEANTEIFDEVFQCVPTDKCQKFVELKEYQSHHPICITDPQRAREMLQGIQGHLVMLPLKFLSGENLLPSAGTTEALMPTNLWT